MYRRTFTAYGTYHQTDCYRMCLQKFLGQNCQCQFPTLPSYHINMTGCRLIEIETGETCFSNNILNSTSYYKECNCPLECDSYRFTYTISTSHFPTLWYYTNILNKTRLNMSLHEVKENLAKVQIGYAFMEQTIISEEKKYEFNDLVSSVGGTLGLFLGLSFLSLVEFVEIVVQTILILVQRKKQISSLD